MSDSGDRKAEIALWQQTLETEFPARVRIQFSFLEEQSETTFRTKFNGHCTLHNSFIEFFGQTLIGVAKSLGTEGWPKNKPSYPALFIKYLGLLRKFRAAELTAVHGYPVEAYAMLRGVRDEAFVLAALALGYADLPAVMKYVPIGDDSKEARQAHTAKQDLENGIRSQLIGPRSGLPQPVRATLQHWDRLFNQEVHGSRLSFVLELEKWIGPNTVVPFVVGPQPTDDMWALYMNRVSELSWLIVRLLPLLLLSEGSLGPRWLSQRDLLDRSHRFMVKGLDKDISRHFEEFLDTKLPPSQVGPYRESSRAN